MSGPPCFTFQAMTASRTTPTLCVFVVITGPLRNPESSTQVVPVISPLPLSVNQAAKTASLLALPRGWIAVTPVRTGPLPTSSLPLPEMSVVWPTSTPWTSVIALLGPGVPSKGTPRSRARALVCADAARAQERINRAKAARVAEGGNDVHLDRLRFNIGLHLNEEVYKHRASGRWQHARRDADKRQRWGGNRHRNGVRDN